MLRMDLRTNGNYFAAQHALVCIYNENRVFILSRSESYNTTGIVSFLKGLYSCI